MFHRKLSNPNPWLMLVVGLSLGVTVATVGTVMADHDDSGSHVPRMIPYDGILEIDGQPVHTNGTPMAIRFILYDGADGEAVYTQDILDIEVYQGRFTTAIGGMDNDGTDIGDVILNEDDLHVGMILLGEPGDSDDIPMSGRQRILATPYAIRTTSATNFNVTNNLNVAGDITADDIATRDLSVSGTIDGGGNPVTVSGNINAQDSLAVGGNLTVGGNLKVDGTISYDGIFIDRSTCSRSGNDITDCYCPTNSRAISGSTLAPGGNTLRESRSLNSGGRSGWRFGCGGPDAIGHCSSVNTHVVCAPLLP